MGGNDSKGPLVAVAVVAVLVVGAVAWFVLKGDNSTKTAASTTTSSTAKTAVVDLPSQPVVQLWTTTEGVTAGADGQQLFAGGQIEERQGPAGVLPQQAVHSPQDVAGQVALYTLPPGTVMDRSYFGPAPIQAAPLPPVGETPCPAVTDPVVTGARQPVVIVKQPIPQGTSASAAVAQGLVEQGTLASEYTPLSGILTLKMLCNDASKAASFPIAPGGIVVSGMFVTPTG